MRPLQSLSMRCAVLLGLTAITPAAHAQVEPVVLEEVQLELTVASIMRGPELVGTSPSRVRWSPDGRRILSVSERSGNRDVSVMKADGSGATRLTNHPASDGDPSWGP